LYEHEHLSDKEENLAKELLEKNGYDCTMYSGDTLAILSDKNND